MGKNTEDTEGVIHCDILGERNSMRKIISMLTASVVQENKWFTCCTKINDSQVDLMSVTNNDGKKLGRLIADSFYTNSLYRTAIYKFLIRNYLCYVEVPATVKNYDGGFKKSYDKMLVTANLGVIASWLNEDYDTVEDKYYDHVREADSDEETDLFPYLKIYTSKEGQRKVSKPRKLMDLGKIGTRVMPVFALQQGVDLLYEKAVKDFVKITFLKDGGALRDITTTFDAEKIKEIYGEGDFYYDGVQGWYNGEFLNNSSLARGYIRVVEVGGSKYDTPLRSINYARIVSIEEVEEPDLTFINIDLGSVVESFKDGVSKHYKSIKDIVDMLDVFDVGSSRTIGNGKRIENINDIEEWVDMQNIVLSTVFQRSLALFMLGNPQWFEGYTGEPASNDSDTPSDIVGISFDDSFSFT